MSLMSQIRQLIESVMMSARISSASPPPYYNRVEAFDWFSEIGDFEETIRTEVKRILEQEGIKGEEDGSLSLGTKPAKESAGTNIESEIKSSVLKGFSSAKDPAGALQTGLMSSIGKIPIPQVAIATLAIAIAPKLIAELTRDGGALDLRWKRLMLKEDNNFLDRQTQRNTQIGLRQVIIQSRAGFIQINGAGGNENNVRQVRDGGVDGNRLAMIGIEDHTKGLFN